MPNGGLTPDCVHCKWYQGKPISDAEPYCNFHNIRLAYPIRAFCSSYVDPEPAPDDWLDQELERDQLRDDLMYIWLGGYEIRFFHIPLVAISEYRDWTEEKFLDELSKLADKHLRG